MTMILSVTTIAALGWFVLTRWRGPRYWGWVRRAWIGMGAPVAIGVAMTGRYDLLARRPPEFDALAARLPALPGAGTLALAGLGGIALGLIARRLVRRPVPARIGHLLPRHRGEYAGAAAMAVTAGLVEEAMFRVWLPWLIVTATGRAAAGFAIATIVFAALHRGQGVAGVVGAAAIGVLMAVLYLSSGALWLMVALHAAFDLNALVASAWLNSSVASRSGRSSRSRPGTGP